MRPERGASWCLFLGLVGLGLAGYLFYLHLGLLRGELLGGPVCSGSGVLNCHAVTAGSWGSFLGMPLAIWGMLGYLLILGLALLARQSVELASDAMTLIFGICLLFVAIDVALLIVMITVIRYYCVFCLLTYGINFMLLLISACSLGRPWSVALGGVGRSLGILWPSPSRPAVGLFWGLLVVGTLGAVGAHASTTFVSQGSFGAARKQIREYLSRQPRVNVSVDGDPSHGPAGAFLQIIEFSDFFCPACQRAAKMNTILLAGHRNDARFVFKHYPLDSSCNDRVNRMVHPGACTVAAASECAHLQGKFWPFHDLLFEKGTQYPLNQLDADLQRLGVDMTQFRACMESGQGLEAVKRDIAEGAKANITSTPTYVMNGVPLAGGIQPQMFEEFVAVLKETR